MKTIIIPDLHLKWAQADQILSWEEPFDRAVFLGDYFDQFGDTPEQNAAMARWLRGKLEDPSANSSGQARYVFCIGNHDWSYMWPHNPWVFCSGFSDAKQSAILRELPIELFRRLKLYHVEQGILCSHAGLDREWFYYAARAGYEFPTPLTLPAITEWLERTRVQMDTLFDVGRQHPLMGAGSNRGGEQKVGGIIWQDFSSHLPIAGVNQIMGHTPHSAEKGPLFKFVGADGVPVGRYASKNVNPRWLTKGWSLCIDTHLLHYVVIEDGALQIKSLTRARTLGDIEFSSKPGKTICEIIL